MPLLFPASTRKSLFNMRFGHAKAVMAHVRHMLRELVLSLYYRNGLAPA